MHAAHTSRDDEQTISSGHCKLFTHGAMSRGAQKKKSEFLPTLVSKYSTDCNDMINYSMVWSQIHHKKGQVSWLTGQFLMLLAFGSFELEARKAKSAVLCTRALEELSGLCEPAHRSGA